MASKNTYHSLNLSNPPSQLSPDFTLTAPSNTDIWHTPSKDAVLTAPVHYLRLPLSTFRTARVTISGSLSLLYDQAGLLLVLPSLDMKPTRWIKMGIERTENNMRQLSVVACDRYADWSLQALKESESSSVTVEFEHKGGSNALWAYVVENGERKAVREVTWAFFDNGEVDREVWVGVYAARPSKKGDGLKMSFSELVIEDEHGRVGAGS